MPITRQEPNGVKVVAPLKQSTGGSSGSFLVLAEDEQQYWCKGVYNLQHPRVPINEQIVARLGQAVGVAVCEPRLLFVSEELAATGWGFRNGHSWQAGWHHGGLAVAGVTETHALEHRRSDDNARRHAGFFALYDWLGGSDPQWLVEGPNENAYYSHDHGHYLHGPGWTTDTLRDNVAVLPAFPNPDPSGLDRAELERLAAAIEATTEQDICDTMANIPDTWPITDVELEAVASYAAARGVPVAARLRAL